MKKNILLTVLAFAVVCIGYAQAPIVCGAYSSVGTVNPYGNGYTDACCGAAVPGTVAGPGVWSGASCNGYITTTSNSGPVMCMAIAYGAVNTNDYATITTDTGGNLTLQGVNMGVNGTQIGPYNCCGQPYGNVLLTVCSDVPFNSVTLTNTGCTSGWVVNCAAQTSCQTAGCSNPCLITNFTANVSACNAGAYSTSGIVEFTDPPTTGTLIIEDCNGNQDVYNAPFTSPQTYNITGQTADGGPCDVTAYFSDDLACTQTINYTAPTCPCNLDNFNVVIGLCDQQTDTYCMTGDIQFTNPPPAGVLIVEVDNGTTIYDTVINPPFVSGQTFSICGIPSDGAASAITVYFSNDPGCTSTINYVAPTSCACSADIGTFSTNITGASTNNYVLCYGDGIDLSTNNDWTGPGEMFNPPGPPYNPGVTWLIYSCPPTVGVTPTAGVNITSDPCYIGVATDNDINDMNNGGSWFDAFPAGTFTNNTVYFVPLTFYDQNGLTYSYVNGTIPCYEMGPYYDVQYLPQFTSSFTEDCMTGTADITVNGGLPAVDGSVFTGSNLLPATASFVNNTAPDGGTFQIQGLQGGDMWSFDITDGNGCPYTVSGGPFPPMDDPTFSYPAPGWCTSDGAQNANVTGTLGGTFAAVPAGLTINAGSGTITPGTSTPGIYDVTYTTPGPCVSSSTVQVEIYAVPTVDPIANETVCVGTNFTAVNFTGPVAGTTFDWANDNTGIGLTASGTGNIAAFPGATTGGTVSGNITVTPSTANCTGPTEVFTLTVNDLDDATFNYTPGLTYCQTATDPVVNITGLAGGNFSYVVASGGPTLDLNPGTGDITLISSDLGTYDVTYSTAGAGGSLCPNTFTLQFVITPGPVADFTLGTYCANDADPLPNYINGGSGGTFTSAPAGLVIDMNSGLVDLSASTPGTYTVTNDIVVAGCPTANYSDDITIFELPDATISGTASICAGDPLPDVTVDITAGAPSWDLTYNFNGAPNTVNSATTPYTITGAAIGTYDLVSITDGNGCTSPINGQVVISEFPSPIIDVLTDQDVCHGDNLLIQTFNANPAGGTFSWTNTTGVDIGFGLGNTGQIGSFTGSNTTTLPDVVNIQVDYVSSDGCAATPENFSVTVNPLPQVAFSGGPLTGCEPLTVTFDNLTQPQGSYCLWNFGNGNQVLGCTQVSNVYNAGTYDVTLTVTTAAGCTAADTYNSYVDVTPEPIALFSFQPQEIDITDPVVDFYNSSIDASYYTWDFDDGSPLAMFEEGAHLYPDTANTYLVEMIAYDANAWCPDTAHALIVIDDIIIFYVPNVFTPDGDEFNETFQPVFYSGYDKFDYHLIIFNRWGEVIFESYNADVGWNGHYGDGGLVQDGVYVWQIEFKENMSDRRHTHRGHVTVLK